MSPRQNALAVLLGDIADAQRGCFTRAQAASEGVDDMRLQRAVHNGSIERLDHGVYRITGAGQDPHQAIRVAWLRLSPGESPRERTQRPHLWVSHRSAARLLDLGVVAADVPEFITDRRIQTKADVVVRIRAGGLERSEWMIFDGFAVTTPAQTVADLAADRMDGGHLGRIASDATERGMTSREELELAVAGKIDIASIIEQAARKAL
ncbi:MAG: type IV toxin-antitoxin system AbiEi family antitoxin domain-containing protein [Actinomycetota bacterium]|nr:type IV toxin-antitoxin system AbiEi family antitoxin domain-containing protein [Actinomycetota bacterium]MDK1103361.1 type IV toxin-antitoxin system AbiEi family antitoxin domain-containing protein [Actinomycetota bacterium]